MMRSFKFVVLLLGTFGPGCGPSAPTSALPPIAPVRGTVLYRGQAIEGVVVTFHPLFDMGTTRFKPEGTSGADGTFTVVSGHGGAPVGAYAVTFTYPSLTDPGDAGSSTDRWKGKYGDPAKGRFKVTVKEGDNQLEPFRLD